MKVAIYVRVSTADQHVESQKFVTSGENAMCEIGKPIEIIDVEPLNLPALLPRTKNEPECEPVVIPAVPATETTLVKKG